MKALSLLLVSLLALESAYGATLTDAETTALLGRAQAFVGAYDNGDAEAYAGMMHSSVYKAIPTKAALVQGLRAAMQRLRERSIVVEESNLIPPSECYPAGKELVCFVRRRMVLQVAGDRLLRQGYLLAVKDSRPSSTWTFLDSDAFETDPQRIFQFLPALARSVVPPPVTMDRMQ